MDEFLNPPQEVPLRVVVTSQPTAGPSTRDPETPWSLTMDEIVNPPQEVYVTSQTAPEAAVQESRGPPTVPESGGGGGQGSRGPQTVPEAAEPTTSRIDLDRRLQELLQRVYGPAGSLEDEQPPVRLFKARYECLAVPIDRTKIKKFIGK